MWQVHKTHVDVVDAAELRDCVLDELHTRIACHTIYFHQTDVIPRSQHTFHRKLLVYAVPRDFEITK